MTSRSQDSRLKQYTVAVGHEEVTVFGRDEADAVRQARRKLGEKTPRLWDMIYKLDDYLFRVDLIQ